MGAASDPMIEGTDMGLASEPFERERPEVAVVVVNYNGTADTLKCLESLKAQRGGRPLVIVVDNGSTPDASAQIADTHPWTIVIRREINGGWAGGNNEGIRHALEQGAGQVILLNNDTIVAPDFVERLLESSALEGEGAILGPIICFMDEPTVVMTDGCDFNGPNEPGFFQRHPVEVAEGGLPEVTEVDIVNGCCMMVPAPLFEELGLIDERFFLIHEESDFCLRAKRAGHRCGIINRALVWHKGSSSFRRSGNGLQRYYDARNLFLLLKEHRATCTGGRGRLGSWVGYLRYIYHRYCHEFEQGERQAAEAVVRGFCDALSGRYGAMRPAPRPALPWLMGLMELGRRTRFRMAWLRGGSA